MDLRIAKHVADYVIEAGTPVTIAWHGGEPLTCGLLSFEGLLDCFAPANTLGLVKHSLQTNGTLINDEWASLFQRHDIDIGVSIDGPEVLNCSRVNWNGSAAYPAIARGIETLRRHHIPFSLLAVVQKNALQSAREIYEFALSTDCHHIGFNVEETEGSHASEPIGREELTSFWHDLYVAWRSNPALEVREIDRSLVLLSQISAGQESPFSSRQVDMFPSVSAKGDVYFLSPEFMDNASSFVVGNLYQTQLSELISRCTTTKYVNNIHEAWTSARLAAHIFRPVAAEPLATVSLKQVDLI